MAKYCNYNFLAFINMRFGQNQSLDSQVAINNYNDGVHDRLFVYK